MLRHKRINLGCLFCLLYWDLSDYVYCGCVLGIVRKSLARGVHGLCFIVFGPTVWKLLNFEVYMDLKIRKLFLLLFFILTVAIVQQHLWSTTLNVNNLVNVTNTNCQRRHYFSTIVYNFFTKLNLVLHIISSNCHEKKYKSKYMN